MKYEAVVFDLFGMLVDVFPHRQYEGVLTEMASILSTLPDEFFRLGYGATKHRGTGAFQSVRADFDYTCQELKVAFTNTQIKEAEKVRFNAITNSLTPRGDALAVISTLISTDYDISLINNCSPETQVIWETTPLAPCSILLSSQAQRAM